MSETNAFIQLFSDEAAAPDRQFLTSLETQFLAKARGGTSIRRVSTRNKILIITGVIAITALVAALVFLPRRDMSDPAQDSIIESVIQTTQQNVGSFTDTDDVSETSTSPNTTEKKTSGTTQSQPPLSSGDDAAPPSSLPATLTGFSADYWNLDAAEIAGTPTIPVSAADYSTTTNTIAFTWGSGSPAASINSDYFVARFSKNSSEINGQYKVVYASDNGLRMHVNETVVFDQWNAAGSSGTAYFTTDPAEPVTSITIEYLELDGPASVSVKITKVN